MLAAVKNKRHTWSFINSYRMPYKKVNVFECNQCKVQKFVYCDSLTHRHIKTEYIKGKDTTTKTPECIVMANLLFD